MKRLIVAMLLCMTVHICLAQEEKDKMLSDYKENVERLWAKHYTARNRIVRQYEERREKLWEEHEAFRRKVMAQWGDLVMVESTKKEWVEYSEDQTRRSIVDFENGKVTVEIIADPEEDEADIDSSLEKAMEDLLSSKGKTIEYESVYIPQDDVTESPIMDGQINLEKYIGEPDEKASKEEIAEQIVREEKKERRDIDTDEGRKTIVSIRLDLVEDHIPKRAERFKGMIRKHSGRFNVNEPLIYALIEQESYFNPMAKSSANAYGLMQLVPESGGRDAYHHVYKKDIIPTPEYLYDPDNNIELGTGYLHKQMTVYFKGVNDPRCRMLCAIAGYNTGQGNVYYALTGKRTMSNAVKKVNTMTYDQLYTYLKHNLPHSETRDYIEKVTSRMQKYIKK